MKQTIAALLLIVPLQALAGSIVFEHFRAESPLYEIDAYLAPGDDPNSLGDAGTTFQIPLSGFLENARFCALSDGVDCTLAALMVVVVDAGSVGHVDVTEAEPAPVSSSGASGTRVPVPGALGLFVTGLLVLGAIRRKRPI